MPNAAAGVFGGVQQLLQTHLAHKSKQCMCQAIISTQNKNGLKKKIISIFVLHLECLLAYSRPSYSSEIVVPNSKHDTSYYILIASYLASYLDEQEATGIQLQ